MPNHSPVKPADGETPTEKTHDGCVKLSEMLERLQYHDSRPEFEEIQAAKELEEMLDWIFAKCEVSHFFDGTLITDRDSLRALMNEYPLESTDSTTPAEKPHAE